MKPNSLPKVAVLTGGHAYDVPNFHQLFRRLSTLDVYVQSMDDFASSAPAVRDGYAAVVFYHMLKDAPRDEGSPWYAGQPRAALERLAENGQGLVALHHGLLAYPEWPTWRELTGLDPALSRYDHDQRLSVRVTDPAHPITAGLADFELVDETYHLSEPDAGCQVLLATEHPNSLRALAWTRTFRRSRVFCLALGHDDIAWRAPGFEKALLNGILWTIK